MVGIRAASGKRGAILTVAQGVANYELASRNAAGPTPSFTEIIGGDAEGRSRLPRKGGKKRRKWSGWRDICLEKWD
jgi:hypothetical protein